MKSTRTRAAIIGCAIAALALGACSSGDNSKTGTDNGSAEVPSQLTVGFADSISTMDPNHQFSSSEFNANHLIGGTLFDFSDDSADGLPGLAQSGEASGDGRVWTIKLRDGLKFSDGTPLTAADAVASLQHATKEGSNQVTVLGAGTKFRAAGDQTVIIKTKAPIAGLKIRLAEPFFGIYPADKLAAGDKFFEKPVSAGPYTLESVSQTGAVFKANPNFSGKAPAIKSVDFKFISDANALLSQVRSGQVDFAYDLPPSTLSTLTKLKDVTTEVKSVYGGSILSVNNKKAPFDDVRVRKAVSLAIDRQAIVDLIYPGQDEVKAQVGFWPSAFADDFDADTSTEPQVDEAKDMLQGTACASGCDVTLIYPGDHYPFAAQMTLLAQQQLEKIGMKVKLVPQEFTSWVQRALGGDFQMSMMTVYNLDSDPGILSLNGLSPRGGLNASLSNFDEPDVEAAIDAVAAAPVGNDKAERAKIAELFTNHQPWIPVMSWARVSASRYSVPVVSLQRSGMLKLPVS